MRYTIAKEKEVKQMVVDGKNIEYISSVTGIPFKVIWGWCPELRPHDDVIKQSVKQRYRFVFPDYEARISTAFSPFICTDITDEDWENVNKQVFNVLFDEAIYVFKNAITEPPEFGDSKKLSDTPFLAFMKQFWSMDFEYSKNHNLKESYVKLQYNSIHFWSPLRQKAVREITKGDIESLYEKLKTQNLSNSRIRQILKTGLIPLKYAYTNGLTLLKTYEYQLPKLYQRKSIPNEILFKIMNDEWTSQEAYIANLIACQCKMQLREVQALTLQDIFTDGYINVSHIYDHSKGYILNPKARNVKVSLSLIDLILKYTSTSPYKDFKPNDFIFYSINRDTPSSARRWGQYLKQMCSKYMTDVSHIDFSIWC